MFGHVVQTHKGVKPIGYCYVCFRLALLSAKYSINHGFDANQALILVIFMSNPL